MNVRWTFRIHDGLTLPMQNFIAGLKNRRALHRQMGANVRETCREWLRTQVATRRNKLGAPASNFWAKAADKVSPPLATDESAVLTLNHPGIRRAFEDIDILPGPDKEFLTLPKIAAAYNRRAYRVKGLFRPLKKRARAIGWRWGRRRRRIPVFDSGDRMRVLAMRTGGALVIWYSLVRAVHQLQDRSLLPSDEDLREAARQGIRDYIVLKHNEAFGKGAA